MSDEGDEHVDFASLRDIARMSARDAASHQTAEVPMTPAQQHQAWTDLDTALTKGTSDVRG